MTALLPWGVQTLVASTALMVLVLALRAPVRRVIGPRLAYALWILPGVRMVMPPLRVEHASTLQLASTTAGKMLVLAIGTPGRAGTWDGPAFVSAGEIALSVWALGAVMVFGLHAIRHYRFCARLLADSTALESVGSIRVVEADVDGPVAFGVFRRFVALPREFARVYDRRERDLALAHECAHHQRGDLIANWAALVVLAAHWCNPIAWLANTAFHVDQEYAADAYVLARAEPSALLPYAALLAKAAGAGAPPVCSLNARSSLRGRLMMLHQEKRSLRQVVALGALTALLGATAVAATALTPVRPHLAAGRQAVTIGVKPDGVGAYSLIVDGTSVAPGAPLPNGLRLPEDFSSAGGCDLTLSARPRALAIKGQGQVETYTVMCATAAPEDVHATLAQGLASLKAMRTSVASQSATVVFPETERAHALAAIDRSIREVRQTLAKPS